MQSAGLTCLSPNLFCVAHICNVYIVRDGECALLIDSGSGRVLNALSELGIAHVDWVLHTHHHRDQCQSDPLLKKLGVSVAVPTLERPLFERVETFWESAYTLNDYSMGNPFFSLTENVPVAAELRDYDIFRWRGYEFLVLPTPGHTAGSVALLAEVDGRRVAFCGDLICTGGRMWTLHDLQWSVDDAIHSLVSLRREGPEWLLPSHGAPIVDPEEAIESAIANLKRLFGLTPWLADQPCTVDCRLRQISPHLIANEHAGANFYVVLSDDGRALFLDYGYPSSATRRFVVHSLAELAQVYGMRTVDLVIPSHYHLDHVAGIPYLQRRYGAKVWAYKNFADILERPEAYNLPASWPREAIQVDRRLQDGESFEWGGFEFQAFHFPGHTEYQMALLGLIDGLRVLLVGDNLRLSQGRWLGSGPAYRCHLQADSYWRAAERLVSLQPDLLLTGHHGAVPVGSEALGDFLTWARDLEETFIALAGMPTADLSLDPAWASFYPYHAQAHPGGTLNLQVHLRNHSHDETGAEVRLRLPPGWQAQPEVTQGRLRSKATTAFDFRVTVPASARIRTRGVIRADVTLADQPFGEVAEAIVEVIL